jgi:small subunit ribosomal protein S25e
LNNAVFWTKPVWDKLQKDVIPKESYLSPSVVSEKLKINVSLAREAIKVLREEQKIAPVNEYHSKYCCFVKTANFVAPVVEKKDAQPQQKGGKGKQ